MRKKAVRRARRSIPFVLPAPVGGLNGRDGAADMPQTDAFVLDNIVPRNSTCDTRNGHTQFATGVTGPIMSLEVYRGPLGNKMLAFGGGKVYDATLGGTLAATLTTGRNSDTVNTVMFSNAGNQYMLGCNGIDAPFSFDGATFANLAITGVSGTQNNISSMLGFKGRMFLGSKTQLGFYYLAVGAIQGAASYFDLQQIASRGGYLLGMCAVSQDMGNGPSDYMVFITSEGEYIVYAGTDPSSAANWTLVSRYYAAPPLNGRSWFSFRSDVYFITQEGVVSFTQIKATSDSAAKDQYISSKLGRYLSDLNAYSGTVGWQGMAYPRGNLLVVNAPASASVAGNFYQFVMNTNTNAWARFTGWNGICFCVMGGRLYFGTYSGKIMLADEGATDNGQAILCDARQAYNDFDDGAGTGIGYADKQFHFATFVVASTGTPAISAQCNVNYEDAAPDYAGLPTATGATWDVATWDIDSWADDSQIQNFTVSFGKIGYAASAWLRISTLGGPLKWYATRMIYEKTSGIVIT